MQVSVSAQRVSIPHQCACCGDNPDTEITVSASRTTGKRVVHTRTNSWAFPYCSRCLQHVAVYNSRNLIGFLGVILGLILLLVLRQNLFLGILALLVCTIPAILVQRTKNRERQEKLKELVSANCTTPARAVTYIGWQGSVQHFDFASQEYATKFMRANQSKLINISPEARQLLLQPVTTNLTKGIPASGLPEPFRLQASDRGQSAPTSDEILLKWINKIESLKGPAARRTAVEAALRSLQNEEQRKRLLLEASRIEVDATLGKVDSLKTASAKKRTLQNAIQELKSDLVPDELQAQLLEMLESELHNLESNE